MFTGIIEAIGQIKAAQLKQGDLSLRINTANLDLSDVALGDSIATNGVCLTVVELFNDGFAADVSNETLSYSTLKDLKVGDKVNLEKALTLAKRLGGHLVSGHVDGVAEILERKSDARSERIWVRVPQQLAKYIAHKGSVTLDGVSLTVNKVDGFDFELNIVPHTAQETIIQYYQKGTKINLEVDQVARYIERLLLNETVESDNSSHQGLSWESLVKSGFAK